MQLGTIKSNGNINIEIHASDLLNIFQPISKLCVLKKVHSIHFLTNNEKKQRTHQHTNCHTNVQRNAII